MPNPILHGDQRLSIGPGAVLGVDPSAEVDGLVRTLSNSPSGGRARLTLVCGEVTLDGSNPTSVATGLTKVIAAAVTLKTAVAPGDDPSWLTADYGGAVPAGQLDVHAWKNTGGTDPTLIASTNNTAIVSWIAFGI